MTTIESLIKEAYFKDEQPMNEKGDFEKVASALNKAASSSFSPESYEAARGIIKVASHAFSSLLKKNQELEKLSAVREIIDDMIDRGLASRDDVNEKTASLMNKNEHEIEVFKEAIKLASVKSMSMFDGLVSSDTSTNPKTMFENVI